MNITSDTWDYLYIGGEEGGVSLYVSVHDATFYPSTGIKHAANLLRVMSNSIGTNESLCTFYLVGLETDGGGDHNHKHIRNNLALFGLLILGNMDKLNFTRGFPGLYFTNTDERNIALLNVGIYGLALKSNVQSGYELLMDEVIGKASLMKSVRTAVQEYDTEIPLDVAVLERHLGRNVYVAAITILAC